MTVSLADHFNNPVPDGTAVSFTAEGGVVGASCLTEAGQCSVKFCAASPRPVDGRITILAYALGEETFQDDPSIANTVNRYDPGEQYQDLCEPFRSDRAITTGEANPTVMDAKNGSTCPSPAVGEPYIDTNGDGTYSNTGNGQYNGVLNIDPATGQTVANGKTPTVHVRRSLVQVLSGSEAEITPLSATPVQLDHCVDGTPFSNTAKTVALAIRDKNPSVFPGNTLAGNILPAGTKIEFSASNGKILSEASFTVPNTDTSSSAVWTYFISIQSDATQNVQNQDGTQGPSPTHACSNPVSSGLLTVKVTTPLGLVTTQSFPVND